MRAATFLSLAGLKNRDLDHGPATDPDASLMMAFRDGDEDAFVTLYHRYRDRIVNYTRRLLGDPNRAEDAAQEVFLKLYRARARYRPVSRFSTYVFRIATNHCINLRSRHDHQRTDRTLDSGDLAHSAATQTAEVENQQLRHALEQALQKLPPKQRAALVLCHYQGLSYREAAQAVGVSESALKSLIHRARATLITQLKPWSEGDATHVV